MPPNGQGKDGDTGNDADKLQHCCGMVAKLFDGVYHLLNGGRLTGAHSWN